MTGKLLRFPGGTDLCGLSDAALLEQCGSHQAAAVGVLFDRFHKTVYRFLSRYIGHASPDLDDLVQATFLEVIRCAGSYRQEAAVSTWILGIAINVARHFRRSEGRRRGLMGSIDTTVPASASSKGPERCAEQQEQLVLLAAALAALPEDLRVVFVLCELEDTPSVQVAKILNLPEGTVWRRLHEAKKRLRAALHEDANETQDLPRARRVIAGIFRGRRR